MLCQHQHPRNLEELREITRRHFFEQCGVGVGKIALASALLGGTKQVFGAAPTTASATTKPSLNPWAVKPTHFPAKAKRVIYLFQVGAPSQLDLYDPKPTLAKFDGQPIPS